MALNTMIGVLTLRGAQLLADFGAAHAGQAQIHQHQVGLGVTALSNPLRPSPARTRPKTFLLQHHADGVAQAFIVVDHENRLHRVRVSL